jgi:hypothetical protein
MPIVFMVTLRTVAVWEYSFLSHLHPMIAEMVQVSAYPGSLWAAEEWFALPRFPTKTSTGTDRNKQPPLRTSLATRVQSGMVAVSPQPAVDVFF